MINAVWFIAACSRGYEVGPCGLPQESSLTSAEDTLGGSFPFTVAAAVEAAEGPWAGELSYNCDGDDSSALAEDGAAFVCGTEPVAEQVTVTVGIPSLSFPITGYVPENRELDSCGSWVILPAIVEVTVESGLFVVSAGAGEVYVSGLSAPEQVDVVGGPATVPAESALSVYGETLDFQMTMGDVILGVDSDPSENIVSTIVASTGTGAMQKIQ